jgi:hypothetical protein
MAKDDDVQLVESIGGSNGTPLESNVRSMHIHGSVGVSSTNVTSNPLVVVISNYVNVASNSTKVEMQQLVVIQVQVIAWKPHN